MVDANMNASPANDGDDGADPAVGPPPADWFDAPNPPADSGLPDWLNLEAPELFAANTLPVADEPRPVEAPNHFDEPPTVKEHADAPDESATTPELELPVFAEPAPPVLLPDNPPLPPADKSSLIDPIAKPFQAFEAHPFDTPNPSAEVAELSRPELIPERMAQLAPPTSDLYSASPVIPRPSNPVMHPVSFSEMTLSEDDDDSSVVLDAPLPPSEAASLHLERKAPTMVAGGRPLSYGIDIPNNGAKPLLKVRVEHDLPAGVRFLGATPAPEVHGRKLIWQLGDLKPHSIRRLLIRVLTDRTAPLPEAGAYFNASYSVPTRITKPRLAAVLSGPESVRVGDHAVFNVEIVNTGSEAATDVVLRDVVPAGLRHSRGDVVEAGLGTLAPGETMKITVRTIAKDAGTFVNEIIVTASGNVKTTAKAEITIVEPALSLALNGPPRCRVDEEVEFTLDVSNSGTSPATRIEVTHTLAEGFDLLSAGGDAFFDASTRRVSWFLDALDVGQSRSFPLRLTPRVPGDLSQWSVARADGVAETRTEAPVSVEMDETMVSHVLDELLASLERNVEPAPEPVNELEAAAPSPPVSRLVEPHIIFTLAGTDYAVPMANVLEIGRPANFTPVPNVPDWVLGVANVRGDVISLVDLARFLDLPPGSRFTDSRLLVVRSRRDEMATGLIVERVKGMRSLATDRLEAISPQVDDRVVPYVRGVSEDGGRLLVSLDLDRLLLSAELRHFELV
jgi:uncharacterized repeat protein (TIGR01451 family)